MQNVCSFHINLELKTLFDRGESFKNLGYVPVFVIAREGKADDARASRYGRVDR